MPETRYRPVVAVDLGGTKIEAAMITRSGQLLDQERVPTQANEGKAHVIEQLFGAIDRLVERSGIEVTDTAGVCVAAAGPVDMKRGIISDPPNLPGWGSVPLQSIVRDRFGVDSYLINDAKAAAVGEHLFGAGKGIDNMVCITLGTGIGGGFILDRRLYFGAFGGAGEVGHMTIDINGPKCNCGNMGCWELYASGTAMEKEMSRHLTLGEKSSLQQLFKAGEPVTASHIAEAARKQDPLALKLIAWSANYIGIGLVNLVNIFNPQMVVIGGGLSKIGPILLDPAEAVVKQRASKILADAVTIVPSALGDDIAVMGAAAYVFEKGAI
jgi:glucokinase